MLPVAPVHRDSARHHCMMPRARQLSDSRQQRGLAADNPLRLTALCHGRASVAPIVESGAQETSMLGVLVLAAMVSVPKAERDAYYDKPPQNTLRDCGSEPLEYGECRLPPNLSAQDIETRLAGKDTAWWREGDRLSSWRGVIRTRRFYVVRRGAGWTTLREIYGRCGFASSISIMLPSTILCGRFRTSRTRSIAGPMRRRLCPLREICMAIFIRMCSTVNISMTRAPH